MVQSKLVKHPMCILYCHSVKDKFVFDKIWWALHLILKEKMQNNSESAREHCDCCSVCLLMFTSLTVNGNEWKKGKQYRAMTCVVYIFVYFFWASMGWRKPRSAGDNIVNWLFFRDKKKLFFFTSQAPRSLFQQVYGCVCFFTSSFPM